MTGTRRLHPVTRTVVTAVCGAALVAAADVLDQARGESWATLAAVLLLAAAVVMLRLRGVGVDVADDDVAVRGILTTVHLPREQVVSLVPGRWRSSVVLEDGSTVPTLLRERDLDVDLRDPDLAPTAA